ncbi:MAG TPA: hypothetical protein VHS35_18130 [Pseudonocardia sp.]|nr:hypothetical protein [Pseudonocardia sp.]
MLIRRRRLLADGYTSDEVQRGVRSGQLILLRKGCYVPPSALPEKPEDRYALRVRATVPELAPDAVISHASAAALFGLPLWGVGLARVHVTRARRNGGSVHRHLHVHSAQLDTADLDVYDGFLVTSIPRTVADLARSLPFEHAVVLADAVLNRGLATREELEAAIERGTRRSGTPAARRVVAFADGRSESPGESRSRVRMRLSGLPEPELQMPINTRLGAYRADFGWPRYRAVGEFDGLAKYGVLLQPGQDPRDAVVAEKRREDAIRDEDWHVTRWVWSELEPFDAVARRIERSFRR